MSHLFIFSGRFLPPEIFVKTHHTSFTTVMKFFFCKDVHSVVAYVIICVLKAIFITAFWAYITVLCSSTLAQMLIPCIQVHCLFCSTLKSRRAIKAQSKLFHLRVWRWGFFHIRESQVRTNWVPKVHLAPEL